MLYNENNVLNINLRGAVRPLLNYLACNERPQWITLGKFLEGWVKGFEVCDRILIKDFDIDTLWEPEEPTNRRCIPLCISGSWDDINIGV